MKHKSPKILREAKLRRGQNKISTVVHNFPFTAGGTLAFSVTQGTGLIVDSPAITFASDPDTGMGLSSGDWITISGQSNDCSTKINHRKVHVARRRQSKGKVKPIMYEIENVSGTTMTIKSGTGLHAGGILTYSA